MIQLATADVFIVCMYFLAVLYIGYRAVRKTSSDSTDFLLAGRSLTLPVFVMTLVSTWYGGILGVGEFSYRYGISSWIVQGVPYYLFAGIFAIVLAKRIRATNHSSIPDQLHAVFDRRTALLGSALTFILMTPAPYILMLSVFLEILFGWSMAMSLVVTAIVAVSYLYWGGLRADVETDKFEFILMFLGFAVIIPFCVLKYGGWNFLSTQLPPLHLTWHGGNSWQFIAVWFFIALWTLVDPAFHQRCYAAKDGKVAKRGILISIVFWLFFDAMTATAGLYSRAVLPNLESPLMAYPMLAEAVLPPVAKGLFYVGMLATIMSTLNTLAFVSAQTLGRDIVLRWRMGELTGDNRLSDLTTTYTRAGLLVSFALAVVLAVAVPSVIELWYTIGTVVVPGLLLPLMASYFERLRVSANYAFVIMIVGWMVSSVWLLTGYLGGSMGVYPWGIEPMYPGLLASLVVWIVGRISYRFPFDISTS